MTDIKACDTLSDQLLAILKPSGATPEDMTVAALMAASVVIRATTEPGDLNETANYFAGFLKRLSNPTPPPLDTDDEGYPLFWQIADTAKADDFHGKLLAILSPSATADALAGLCMTVASVMNSAPATVERKIMVAQFTDFLERIPAETNTGRLVKPAAPKLH